MMKLFKFRPENFCQKIEISLPLTPEIE